MAPKIKIDPQLGAELEQAAKQRAPIKRSPSDHDDHQEDHDDKHQGQASQAQATKRPRVPLNFSIESIMQPIKQVSNNNSNSNFHQTSRAPGPPVDVSRSPSPGSDAGSSRSSGAESVASSLASEHNGFQKQQLHQQQHHNNNDNMGHLHLNLNHLVNSDAGGFVSSCSSQSSSRLSSPISPGCNSNTGNQHHHQAHRAASHTSKALHTKQQQQNMNHHHHHRHNNNNNNHPHDHHHHQQQQHHLNQHNQHHQASTSASHALSTGPAHSQTSGATHTHTTATSATAATATTTNLASGSTGRLNQVECVLDNKDMWDKFHSLNTEMIITKTGRRMFPVLKVQFHNLDPSARYAVSMDIVPVDQKRYRYAYHKSCWQVAGKADPPPTNEPRLYPHPDSPFNGDLLSRQVISFEKVKLTNNEMDKSGHIILNSMHKYQPRVHLIELKSTLVTQPQQIQQQQMPPLNGKLNSSRYPQQQQQRSNSCPQQQAQLDIEGYRTFVFPETVFTAVTAYQNQLITKMKIDKNPFAKGFRDSSRLSDLDRNDPFEGFMSLGPAAAAAAVACAGRFPGGPQGPGGVGGPGGLPPGSFEAAAAAAAAAGMQPGNPGGQMDQAYAQLLASAAAANSPWYSAAAAAAAAQGGPFGSMAPSCSSAQAAQQQQQFQATQMWLAAFSALSQLPPPPPGGGGVGSIQKHEPLESTGQLQECRGDSRSSG